MYRLLYICDSGRCEMINADDLTSTSLVLQQVTEIYDKELGCGTYGRVYAVNYLGKICAAKEIQLKIYSSPVDKVGQVKIKESVLKTCVLYSELRHPNVIQFLGVYYPIRSAVVSLPAMVMEMMSYNLTSFVNNHQDIPVHIKYSIVHDVSLGLRYLHNYDPPIVHQNLFPNNILLTGCFVAKISDIALANGILDEYLPYSSSDYTIDFIAPEVFSGDPISTPMDVFSFAGIILYVFSQKWPRVSIQKKFNCHAVTLSEAEKRLEHLEKMETEFTMVKPLVVECLNDDPAARPTMEIVSERIQRDKNKCATQTPYDGTTFNIPLKQTRNVARLQQNLIIKVGITMHCLNCMHV